MKKTLTFLLLFTTILFALNEVVNAQTEVWNQAHTWNTGKANRGIAYYAGNNHLYVAGNTSATDAAANYVQVLDAATGDVVNTLTLETLGVSDNGYGIKDVEVSMDGGIFATIPTTNTFNPPKLYYWSNEDADPQLLWNGEGDDQDFGPGFSIYGDISGDALIIIPFYDVASVYYWEVVDGVLGSPTTLSLTGITGSQGVHVQALGTKITDGFWYSNFVTAPTKIDGSGNIIGSIDATVFASTTTGDVKQFMAGSNTYLAVSSGGGASAAGGNVTIVDITAANADFSNITISEVVTDITGTAPSEDGWPPENGDGQEQVALGNPDGSYVIYSLSSDNYVKAVATDGAPTAAGLLLSGSPLVGEIKNAEYTYIDINGDAEATSEIKWYVADDESGTNISEITANAGNMTYSLDAGDVGKYISFTILPVAATGTVSNPLHLATSNSFGPVLATETAPVASNTAISGVNEVGEVLTASYDFSDAGGDLEGNSDYKWYRVDDNTGTNAAEAASGSLDYTIQEADAGKYLMFVVTPASATGWPLVGEPDSAFTSDAILFLPAPPVASDVAISGRQAVEAILTGSYTYSDVNGDEEHPDGSIQNWWSADTTAAGTLGGDTVKVATDTNQYQLQTSDYRRIIWYEVIPVSVPTDGVDTGMAVIAKTDTIEARPMDYPPNAKDVILSGTPEVGALLSAVYTYEDTIVNDPEGESIFKWYIADDAAGTNATLIDGADDQTLLVTEAQIGKHFIFEVTPVAQTGGELVGDPVQSNVTADAAIASSNTFGIERLWLGSSKVDAVPFYINPAVTTERGFAIGADKIYLASRYNGTKIVMLDKNDGSYLGELSTEGISGGIYPINDVEVSDDGQILAAPLAADGTFWIYKWENENADPEKWLDITLPASWRMGDKFSVTGDLTGDAIIMAVAASDTNKIVRWVITGGIPAEPDFISLDQNLVGISSPAAVPLSVSADANILVDGKGLAPTIFDKDGNNLGSIAKIDDYGNYKIQSNSPNVFQYKGRTMAAFFQAMRQEPLGARIIVADITAAPYQIIDSSEYVSNSMAWDGYLGEVDVTTDGDYYYAYQLQAKNAVAAYRGELVLPEFVSAQTNYEGTMIYTVLDKALMEITENTNAAPWTITADEGAVSIDSIWSGNDTIYFELASAITEGQDVTIAYDGTGTIASFNGMPLAAFGPEPVLNIVGADVPVATDVEIAGTPNEGETLTGSYTFNDPDGDAEGDSEYQWWEATDASGSGALKLIGQTSETYTVETGMVGKFVAFEVTPVSATGGADYLVGEPAVSAWMEIVEPTNGLDASLAESISMYPNPVKDVLTITNAAEIKSVSVIDLTGKVILNLENNMDDEIKLPVSELKNGMYFIKVISVEGSNAVKSIIKQ